MKNKIFKLVLGLTVIGLPFASCTQEIDDSARYTLTEETLTDYCNNREYLSEFAKIMSEVPVSPYTKSSVSQLLSARGNFILLAPTNNAIRLYLDSVANKGIIDRGLKHLDEITDKKVADSLKKVIVYNAVVDVSEYSSAFVYIADLAPEKKTDTKVMSYSNLNNRFLSVNQNDTPYEFIDEDGTTKKVLSPYVFNTDCHIQKFDIKVHNGIIHEMVDVVAPSNDNMLDVLGKAEGVKCFAYMLSLCGLQDTLSKDEDATYHELYFSNPSKYAPPAHKTQGAGIKPFENRWYGFTAFAETDEVYKNLGVVDGSGNLNLEALRQKLAAIQPAGLSQDDNYTDENNWLNYFVTYHLLPMKLNFDHMVIHYNETGYSFKVQGAKYTLTQNEYYTSMGKPRILKISEGGDQVVNGTNGIRLNYFAKLNRNNPMIVEQLINQGILVQNPTMREPKIAAPKNGIIYPIDELLVYGSDVSENLGTERMRIDMTALFPELTNCNVRRQYKNIGDYGFTRNYHFLSNMDWSEESNVYYFPGYNSGWNNFMGDEFNVTGIYDITIKLPPIPYSTTYELRVGVSSNPYRGLMQVYFGSNKNSMPAAGIPLDMRMGGVLRYWVTTFPNYSSQDSNVGWVEDSYAEEDQTMNDENDKRMRLQGFMKAPAGFVINPDEAIGDDVVANLSKTIRNKCNTYGAAGNCMRRIVLRQDLQEGETYYVRFKSVLEDENSQLFLDYFELVPKAVYDNPMSPEDIW